MHTDRRTYIHIPARIHMHTVYTPRVCFIMSYPFAHLRMTISLLAKFQPGRVVNTRTSPITPTTERLPLVVSKQGTMQQCQDARSGARTSGQPDMSGSSLGVRVQAGLRNSKHVRDSVGNKWWCYLVDTQMPPHYLTIIFHQLLFCC